MFNHYHLTRIYGWYSTTALAKERSLRPATGKAKTISQTHDYCIVYPSYRFVEMMFDYVNGQVVQGIIVDSLIIVTILLTFVSGLDYILKNRHLIFESK